MSYRDGWFTEFYETGGTGFSLKSPRKIHDEQSAFQHIEVYETETFGNLMVIDGCTMVSQRDNFIYHEMMAHPALFSHAAPQRVAIIGGGDCGTLREVLKHEVVESVIQIDIDERVTRVAEQYFPELCESNDDPRAELAFIDGLAWMKQQPAGSLDVIIVDSTDPVGPGEVLFTPEFFADCHRVLAEGGLFVQQSESPLLHAESIIRPMHVNLRGAGFADVSTLHFPLVIYPSGWWSATLACKDGAISPLRVGAEKSTLPPTEYYDFEVHRASFTLPRFLRTVLSELN